MKLKINGVRISIVTDKGNYGTTAIFQDGLNIVRAENTSGKSTLINSIFYALGLEIILGKFGIEELTRVLKDEGDYKGEIFNVIESSIEVEIENIKNKTITIRRYVKHDKKDNKLVEVITEPIITANNNHDYIVNSFFLKDRGASQRDKGFHYFLSNFLELDLPFVKRFTGNWVPLYIECLVPLFFIEQKRGWTAIQATLPLFYGIRNIKKLAIEYLLNLDVIENEKKKIDLMEKKKEIELKWTEMLNTIRTIVSRVKDAKVFNIPKTPAISLKDKPWIAIIDQNKRVISLNEKIELDKKSLVNLSLNAKSNSMNNDEETEKEISVYRKSLYMINDTIKKISNDIVFQEKDLEKLKNQLAFIKKDILNNNDILKLQKYGSEHNLIISEEKCPTCNQSIQDSLIQLRPGIMTIQDNINSLKAEKEALELLVGISEAALEDFREKQKTYIRDRRNIRKVLNDLKTDLNNQSNYSIAFIRREIKKQERIDNYIEVEALFSLQLEKLYELAGLWKEFKAECNSLPTDYFSKLDRNKLKEFSRVFKKDVNKFEFRSINDARISISKENYKPVADDFEISGCSASDNIRLIWAYTLSLLKTSNTFNCNHFGLLILDEPEQQNMKELSSEIFYKELTKIRDSQIIVATSTPEIDLNSYLKKIEYNLLEYGDVVIRPIDDKEKP